ncbi:MAG TPA: hypothetical protein QGF58_01935 [Myxococcota bacterium]|nr:hypothetical protein [Myxococcota bacterium]
MTAPSAWSVDGIVASGPNEALEADFDWSLAVDSTGLTIDGSWSSEVVQTDGAPYANELDIVGLTWSFTDPCRCPTAGDISQVLVATLETVTIDWDDFINLGDGSDDFEPQEIDIEDVDVTVESLVSFSSCSATVTVDADDVEIVLPKEETGLPIDLTVTLPASATADALEAVLQAALDGMC